MHKQFSRRLTVFMAGVSAIALGSEAQAQVKRPTPDENGVDVISGLMTLPSGRLTIGQPAAGGLEFYRVWYGGNWYHNLKGTIVRNGPTYTVTVGSSVETFTLSGTVYVSDDALGSTLSANMVGVFTYTLADGSVLGFENPGQALINTGLMGMLVSRVRPNGQRTTYTNKYQAFCELVGGTCDAGLTYAVRLQSVTNTNGYHLKLEYGANYTTTTPKDLNDIETWQQLVKVTGINSAIDYCDPNANSCIGLTQSWPSATIAKTTGTPGNFTDVWADALSNATTGQVTSNALASIQSPADPAVDFSLTYSAGRVATFAQGGGTWTYGYADVGTQRTTTVTQPLGGSKVYVSDTSLRKLLSTTDELGRATSYQYDGFVRPTRVTQPEGNYLNVTYDARGNVTLRRNVAKAGSGLADIVSSAVYPATCANSKTCNAPTSSTDARGNTTDFTYDPNHGGVLTATSPAPTTGAVRPQVRAGYSPLFAYYKNSAGVIVAAPIAVTKLTSVSACQTLASCAGAADEAKSTIAYGAAGVANNLLPTSIASGNGTGTLTATTARAYDIFGNLTSVDGPLAGTADTYGLRYDADRRLTTRVSPDPDGAGVLKMRAQRLTYNADSNVAKVEAGTTTTLTGPFTPVASAERVQLTYDTLGRTATQALVSGTTTVATHALTQMSYDTKGRPSCTATRMNPAVYASLPASACTIGTAGSFGPDRITQTVYDNADEATQNQVAVGTTDAAAERILTYTSNGRPTTLKDAENNLTTYEYDGFDRLSKTRYPSPAKGSGVSSTTDFEQLGYDPGSNVTSRRLRDAASIAFTYDNLNRATLKNLPGTEPDVTYGYDNLDRVISASQTGNSLTFNWDTLSRKISEVGPIGTTSFGYDLADRRTSITYPTTTALTIDYGYLVTGELSTIKQSTTALATYGYDTLGNRTSVAFGNGAAQAFSYDPVSRLAQLTNDLSGTTNDLTATFAYNPASQIASTTRTGDAYAWTGHGNGSTAYTQNGLNQQITVGGAATTWDSKGNLVTEPQSGKTYGYSSENLLTSSSGGTAATLSYDPALRLYQVAGAATTRFVYDGLDAIAEYNSASALQRRFVFDPTTGQPVLWYEGTGTAATDRRYMSEDERGSVISVSDSTAASLGLNRYDEYGKPQSTNLGRFQYTGQKWIGEAGVYDYHYRAYVPQLGIFAQPDPIGQADSPNLYPYVLGDPVNLVDPLGLCPQSTIEMVWVCARRQQDDGGTNRGRIGWSGLPGSGIGRGDGPNGGDDDIDKQPKEVAVPCPKVTPGKPGNHSQSRVAFERPGWQTINARISAIKSSWLAGKEFPGLALWNDAGDAWRHFRWSFSMASSMGPEAASAFANAHEVSSPGLANETAMDMFNNAMGRAFSNDTRTHNLTPDQAATLALRSGCLQTRPK